MKFEKGTTKEQKLEALKKEMKKISGELGMIDVVRGGVGRGQVEYNTSISAGRRAFLRREFGKLQAQHKRLYFS